MEYSPNSDPRPRSTIIQHRLNKFDAEMADDPQPLPAAAQEFMRVRYQDQLREAATLAKNYPADTAETDYQRMKRTLVFSSQVLEMDNAHNLSYPNSDPKMVD